MNGISYWKVDIFTALFFKDHVGLAKTDPDRSVRIGNGLRCEHFDGKGWYIVDNTSGYRIFYGPRRVTRNMVLIYLAKKFIDYIKTSPKKITRCVDFGKGKKPEWIKLNKYLTVETDTIAVEYSLKECDDKELLNLYKFTQYGFSLDLTPLLISPKVLNKVDSLTL